jgi:hypothetical protein
MFAYRPETREFLSHYKFTSLIIKINAGYRGKN